MVKNNLFYKSSVRPAIPSRLTSTHNQKGVVLIVTLVFLVALTGVAAALMQSTTSDMKMTSASNEKVIASQAAISAIDEILDNQINQRAVNLFAGSLGALAGYTTEDLLPAESKTGVQATASVINNPLLEEKPCPRNERGAGTSEDVEMCNVVQLQVTRAYGRNDSSTVVVNAVIAQKLSATNQ